LKNLVISTYTSKHELTHQAKQMWAKSVV